jgi:hypothetical protein
MAAPMPIPASQAMAAPMPIPAPMGVTAVPTVCPHFQQCVAFLANPGSPADAGNLSFVSTLKFQDLNGHLSY